MMRISASDAFIPLSGQAVAARSWRSGFAEDAPEDRIDMLGVVAEVEFLANLFFGEGPAHLIIGKKFFKEILALLPYLHGLSLNQTLGVLTASPCLGERQKDTLAHPQPL